jgi:hypothetical protein
MTNQSCCGKRMARGNPALPAGHAATFKCVLALAFCALLGCAEVEPTGSDVSDQTGSGIAETKSSLAALANITAWSQGVIQVCAENVVGIENEWFVEAMRDSWSQVINIDFWYTGLCSHSIIFGPNHIVLHFNSVNTWSEAAGASGWGVGSPRDVDINYCHTAACLGADLIDYREAFKYVAVHEIGHALGFTHEQDRIDSPTPPNEWTDPSAILLGDFDFDSIMLYGRGWDGNASLPYQVGYKGGDRISALDARGAQNLYGRRLPYWQEPVIDLLWM